jgi:gas vesicle protein
MLSDLSWQSALEGTWTIARPLLDSNFVSAAIGSLAGAVGGAWAAQRIAEQAKRRDDILREIRNTNAAMALTVSITNTFLGIKRQHVKKLYDEFNETKSRVEKAIRENQGRSQPAVIEFRANLETLPATVTPIEQLQNALFEKVALEPGPLMLVPILSNSISAFNVALGARNQLISQWKGRLSEPDLVPLYFGFKHKGNVDQTYPSIVDAIYTYNNDSIAFSRMLARLLNEHGNRKKAEFRKRFRGTPPNVSNFDLSKGEDVLPDEKDYADWEWVFEKKQAPPARWYSRFYEKLKLPRFWPGKTGRLA